MNEEWADPNRPPAGDGTGRSGPPPDQNRWAAPTYQGGVDPYAPPYGAPNAGGPQSRGRTALIVCAAIALVLVLGIAGIVIDAHHGTSSSSTSATSSDPLDAYLLSPAEVHASGMDLIDGGRGVDPGDATLDWCGRTYPSDEQRAGRVQVEYEGSTDFVSNEFVRYNSGGAGQAYVEIKAAVSACRPSFQAAGAETDQIQIASASSSLVADQVTVSAFEAGQVPLWTAVVYQFDGNFFSGVYVSGSSRAAVLADAQNLGAKAAVHLRQAVAGTAGSGGGVVGSPPPDSSAPAGGGAQT